MSEKEELLKLIAETNQAEEEQKKSRQQFEQDNFNELEQEKM